MYQIKKIIHHTLPANHVTIIQANCVKTLFRKMNVGGLDKK